MQLCSIINAVLSDTTKYQYLRIWLRTLNLWIIVGAEIWQYFLRSESGKLAQCKVCKKVLKCDGGSTKGLHVHLKSTHQIEITLKRKNDQIPENDSQSKCTKVIKIDFFLN